MTLKDKYRERYKDFDGDTVAEWLAIIEEVDPKAKLSSKSLGVYIEFSDGSIWLLGAAERSAACMKG